MKNQNDDLSKKIKSVIESFVNKKKAGGCNVLIFKDGEEAAYCDCGFRDIGQKLPFSRDTIFRLYSQTKPITAAATVLLASRGKLDLSAWLSDYLEDFSEMFVNDKNGRRKAANHITVQNLLDMSAGLAYPDDRFEGGKQSAVLFEEIDRRLHSDSPMTTMEFAGRASKLDLCFEPGTHFLYGICADVLGALVEKISEKSFGQFLRENFFEPLEMNDTGFFVSPEKSARFAKAYNNVKGNLEENITNHLGNIYERNKNPAFESGGAGLVSTVDDYMNFATMLMNGGMFKGKKIMEKSAVDYLTKHSSKNLSSDLQSSFEWMKGYSYSNLMRHCVDCNEAHVICKTGEYGWDGWMGSFFSNDPESKISFVMGVQVPGVFQMGSMARQIKNLVTSYFS